MNTPEKRVLGVRIGGRFALPGLGTVVIAAEPFLKKFTKNVILFYKIQQSDESAAFGVRPYEQ